MSPHTDTTVLFKFMIFIQHIWNLWQNMVKNGGKMVSIKSMGGKNNEMNEKIQKKLSGGAL